MDKAVKTKNTSTRLGSNTAAGVEKSVLKALPRWRSYPRCVRVVFGQLYRFGSMAECMRELRLNEDFDAEWDRNADAQGIADLEKVADVWYKTGKLPKGIGKDLTFTQINQQLFYEATMGSNGIVALGAGGATDLKMAIEGGYGNHLEIERARHNAIRKARAEFDAKQALENDSFVQASVDDMFNSKVMEYNPLDVNPSD